MSADEEAQLSWEKDQVVTPAVQGAGSLSFNQADLQKYILLCAQQVEGGLRDKPGKPRDYYHTCYNLSGLSVAQHCLAERLPVVLGQPGNALRSTNPVYNICEDKVRRALRHFRALPCSHEALLALSG